MDVSNTIESILFVASKPLTVKQIAKAIGKSESTVTDALETLAMRFNADAGIQLARSGDTVQFITHPENAPFVDTFIKDEVGGDLTKAQLESLTIIAYSGPMSRAELEQIRGVNCSVILRNLMMRGLIEEQAKKDDPFPTYTLSIDALRHLGVSKPEDLPEYDTFHGHAHIEEALQQ